MRKYQDTEASRKKMWEASRQNQTVTVIQPCPPHRWSHATTVGYFQCLDCKKRVDWDDPEYDALVIERNHGHPPEPGTCRCGGAPIYKGSICGSCFDEWTAAMSEGDEFDQIAEPELLDQLAAALEPFARASGVNEADMSNLRFEHFIAAHDAYFRYKGKDQ